jgi:hypothetical protein
VKKEAAKLDTKKDVKLDTKKVKKEKKEKKEKGSKHKVSAANKPVVAQSEPKAKQIKLNEADKKDVCFAPVMGTATWGFLPLAAESNDGIRLGIDCAGMLPEAMAMESDEVRYKIVFASEKDPDKVKLMNHLHGKDFKLYESVESRNNRKAEYVDIYGGGFPCQPFSDLGVHGGFKDLLKRGIVIATMTEYIKALKPRCVLLENVKGLVHKHNAEFKEPHISYVTQARRCGAWSVHGA